MDIEHATLRPKHSRNSCQHHLHYLHYLHRLQWLHCSVLCIKNHALTCEIVHHRQCIHCKSEPQVKVPLRVRRNIKNWNECTRTNCIWNMKYNVHVLLYTWALNCSEKAHPFVFKVLEMVSLWRLINTKCFLKYIILSLGGDNNKYSSWLV